MHSHVWKPVHEGKVPLIGVTYTLMVLNMDETLYVEVVK